MEQRLVKTTICCRHVSPVGVLSAYKKIVIFLTYICINDVKYIVRFLEPIYRMMR